MSSPAKKTKAKLTKDCINLKSFYTVKEAINQTKMPPPEWENIFANSISDEVLI